MDWGNHVCWRRAIVEQEFSRCTFPSNPDWDTLVYLCRTSFALRSVQEHWDLQMHSFELVERTGEVPYLVYWESIWKNQGSNSSRQQSNGTDLYLKKYCEHRPQGVDHLFYYVYIDTVSVMSNLIHFVGPLPCQILILPQCYWFCRQYHQCQVYLVINHNLPMIGLHAYKVPYQNSRYIWHYHFMKFRYSHVHEV